MGLHNLYVMFMVKREWYPYMCVLWETEKILTSNQNQLERKKSAFLEIFLFIKANRL